MEQFDKMWILFKSLSSHVKQYFTDRFEKEYKEVEKNADKYQNVRVQVPPAVFGKKLFGNLIG